MSFASNWVQWILLIGIFTIQVYPAIMFIGIILFAATTLFSFITLPVEINASQRALAWLNQSGVTDATTHDQAQDALKWAAYTYVVAALGSLATLVYYILISWEGVEIINRLLYIFNKLCDSRCWGSGNGFFI